MSNKKLRSEKILNDESFTYLEKVVKEFAEKWGVETSEVSVEADTEHSWGSGYCILKIWCYSVPSEEEAKNDELENKRRVEANRLRKLDELERLQKELGIK